MHVQMRGVYHTQAISFIAQMCTCYVNICPIVRRTRLCAYGLARAFARTSIYNLRILRFVQVMAVFDSNLRLASAFDGVFASLPRDRVCGGDYLAVPYLLCNPNCRLYVASVSSSIVGGSLINGMPQRETLCVLLLGSADKFSASQYVRQTLVPARFFWLTQDYSLRRARLYKRGDSMHNIALAAYCGDARRKHVTVHRVLGWTFRCPPSLFTSRWSAAIDVEHLDNDHGNNTLSNLCLWKGAGEGGHRQASGRKGPVAKRRRVQG